MAKWKGGIAMVITSKQNFGDDPIAVRKTDHYAKEYNKGFAQHWDQLIDWERRAKSEGDFFIQQLRERGKKEVLDVATGTGFHSVRLLKAGFRVVSADGCPEMLARAFENGRAHGQILRTVEVDWRHLTQEVNGRFDAVICLGNSFTHLFDERDRRKALAEFYAILKHDGVLILDQRNYDAILDDRYTCEHQYYYCGQGIEVQPVHVDDGLARFRYAFADGSEFHLNMFPLRKAYTKQLMREAGFQRVITYGDFKDDDDDVSNFFIHVAEKVAPG